MTDEFVPPKDQFAAFGLPPGPSAPNAERKQILNFLEARRREGIRPAVLEDQGDTFGYAALAIPELDYAVLVVRFPDLASKDAEISHRAWKDFARSDASLAYRVDASIGKRQHADGIIIR